MLIYRPKARLTIPVDSHLHANSSDADTAMVGDTASQARWLARGKELEQFMFDIVFVD